MIKDNKGTGVSEQDKRNILKRNVLVALLTAIILLLTFTPLGYLRIPGIEITLIPIPVIVGSIFLGPKKGMFLGFVFGFTSMLYATMVQPIHAFLFTPFTTILGTARGSVWSLVVCYIPRLLCGWVPGLVWSAARGFSRKSTFNRSLALIVSAALGVLVHTLGVLGFIYLFFADFYAKMLNIDVSMVVNTLIGIASFNGAIELLVITTAVFFISMALLKSKK